jgi:hypothetical protein
VVGVWLGRRALGSQLVEVGWVTIVASSSSLVRGGLSIIVIIVITSKGVRLLLGYIGRGVLRSRRL